MAIPANSATQNTSHKVVIPFYVFAALALLVSTVMLLFSTEAFMQHHFHPKTLAITHMMALGWGTMIILGASYQLVPVLIEHKLYNDRLANASFYLAAVGVPVLSYAFYNFNMKLPAQLGGIFINAALILFLWNLIMSMMEKKKANVHAIFMLTATCWLLMTTITGLLLVYNFSFNIFSNDSLHYLPFHAHLGIAGWFLLLVVGVGSRLIPMFLISKYTNEKRLWLVYFCINGGLLLFVFFFLMSVESVYYIAPVLIVLVGIVLFMHYCYNAVKIRIRKQVDEPMKISMFSVPLMIATLLLLMMLLTGMAFSKGSQLVLTYGFSIFFGWLTALIFGMTFKTLPFIVWNKVYHSMAGKVKTPNPKDLFSSPIFNTMSVIYIAGFISFATALLIQSIVLIQVAAVLLFAAAILYNWNVIKLVLHKSVVNDPRNKQ